MAYICSLPYEKVIYKSFDMECWEQSTQLSWLTTNTTQSHTQKKALVPNKQKQERTHKKLQLSSTFTCVTCSTKSPYVNWGKVAPCTQVVHNSYKSWSQAAHKVAHTPWCASWSQVAHKVAHKLHTAGAQVDHKLHAIPFHFRSKLLH